MHIHVGNRSVIYFETQQSLGTSSPESLPPIGGATLKGIAWQKMTSKILALVFGFLLAAMNAEATPSAESDPSLAYTVGYFEAQAAIVDRTAALLRSYARDSRLEHGYGDVRILQEVGYPSRFVILEQWAEHASLAAHENGSVRRHLLDAVAQSLVAPPDWRLHRDFWGKPLSMTTDHRTLYVITHLDVAPPAFPALQEMARPYFEDERDQHGFLGYAVLQNAEPRQNHLTAIEMWKDAAALSAQRATLEARQFRQSIAPILGALYDERQYYALSK
jgi:quinol monooxygenase YgiN